MKKIEIFLRRIILKFLIFFYPAVKSNDKPQFNRHSVLLFIRLNRIGDALVSTALLRAIKEQTGCNILVLADVKNYFVFEHCPSVDKTFIYIKSSLSIKKIIEKESVDAIIDLHDDVSTTVSLLLMKSNVKYKIGFKKSNSKIYTHTVKKIDSSSHHIVERIMQMGNLFNLKTDLSKTQICYVPSQKSINFAENFLIKNKLNRKYLVGINITAGSDARFWGTGNFRQLIDLLQNFDVNFIVFTTAEKLSEAKEIVDEQFIFPVSDDFDIFAAGISKVNLLFTPDTSVVHIASVYQIPVFGLYVKYNTTDHIWSPYNTDFDCVITEEPTLKNVTFEEVKNKFLPFFEKHINAKRNSIV